MAEEKTEEKAEGKNDGKGKGKGSLNVFYSANMSMAMVMAK